MTHLVAILLLALACAVWIVIQRAAGLKDGGSAGATCGACANGVCHREIEQGCERAERARDVKRAGIGFIAVLVLVAAGWLGYATMSGSQAAANGEPVAMTRELMGTTWSIQVVPGEADRDAVERAIGAAFAEVDRVERMMSEWREDSPLSAINESAGGDPVAVPSELRDIISRGIEYGRRSGGAFDITWLGMGDIWSIFRPDFQPPSPEAVAEAMERVDYRRIIISGDRVGLPEPGMAIGLGGIAKGYAVDRAAAVLRSASFENFYIDGGGDVLVSGRRGPRPWRVGVRNPRGGRTSILAVLSLEEGAVVTSGDYERYREIDGVRYHHIIDPRTGRPARESIAVTVYAPSAEAADALATAAFVLGPEAGSALIEETPDTEALLVGADGQVHVTSGWARLAGVSDAR